MTARYQTLTEGGVWDFETRTRLTLDKTPKAWAEYQAWLTSGGEPVPPDTVGQLTLAEAKAQRIADINSHAAGLRNRAVAGRSAGEMASWALKLSDAMAITAGQPSPYAAMMPALGAALGLPGTPTSINHALALVRGVTEAEHAGKVLTQAMQVLVLEVAVDAVRGKHCDTVAALTDVRDIVVYSWLTGWPEIAV